jgi:organic hydroperoxide reductase OsmC/OhrA
MQPYPHTYVTAADGAPVGPITVSSPRLEALSAAAPVEFGGPGDHWSPETLLVGAVSSCFLLTFRAVSRAARLPWTRIECRVEGVLDRVKGVSQFTLFRTYVTLTVLSEEARDAAYGVLHRAHGSCLITNSLRARQELETRVEVAAEELRATA